MLEWGTQAVHLLQNKMCLRLFSTPAANWHGKAHVHSTRNASWPMPVTKPCLGVVWESASCCSAKTV